MDNTKVSILSVKIMGDDCVLSGNVLASEDFRLKLYSLSERKRRRLRLDGDISVEISQGQISYAQEFSVIIDKKACMRLIPLVFVFEFESGESIEYKLSRRAFMKRRFLDNLPNGVFGRIKKCDPNEDEE